MDYTGVNQVFFDLDSSSTHAMPGPFRMVVRGFSRYGDTVDSLPIPERTKLVIVTKFVLESFLPGNLPILGIRLVGHADTDPQREQREPGFIQRISEKRAAEIERYLKNDVARGSSTIIIFKNAPVPAGPRPDQIRWQSSGVGASQPDEENKRGHKTHANMTEQDRQLNRRVQIFLEPGSTPVPQPQPTDLLEVLRKTIREWYWFPDPPRPPILPPWFWDPKFPGPVTRDQFKKLKCALLERLKKFDVRYGFVDV